MSLFDSFFPKDPKELFLDFTPVGATWSVVSWNFDLKDPSHRQWTLEVFKKEEQESIEWEKNSSEEVRFFKAHRLVRKRRIPQSQLELRDLMNLCIHSTLKEAVESHHEFLLTPVSGATTMDFQNEFKAKQWLDASLGTLGRALDQFDTRQDLVLTGAIFSGLEPDTQRKVLRVLIFNLDIFLYFENDFSLRVVVFDDKNTGPGSAKSPSFQQIIKVTKPQIYDEIIKLVHQIATVGEIR